MLKIENPIPYDTGLFAFAFALNSIWRCPTLTWGNPTLPSALRHFTSEFGMESGRTTALWSPEYSVLALSFVSYSALT